MAYQPILENHQENQVEVLICDIHSFSFACSYTSLLSKILQVRKTTLVEILLGAELWSIVSDKGGRNSMLSKNGLQYCDYAGRGGESEFLYFHKA